MVKRYFNKIKKPFIVAEAGINHSGNIKTALKLVDMAKSSGADAIKFQTFKTDSRVSGKVKSANYVEKADGLREDIKLSSTKTASVKDITWYDMLNGKGLVGKIILKPE